MSMMKATLPRLAAKGKTLIRRIIGRNSVIYIAEAVVVNGEAQRTAGRNSQTSEAEALFIKEDQVTVLRNN